MTKQPVFTFYLGEAVVTTSNINELREYVEELQEKKHDGLDWSKHLADFCFDVEIAYRRYHDLEEDNWDIVH